MGTVKRIACGNVNCYLLCGRGQSVLVDAARPGYAGKILAACEKAGVKPGLIFLTHGHIDHIGNAAALAAAWGAPIAMSGKDTGMLADPFAQPMRTRGLIGRVIGGASRSMMKRTEIPAFEPDILLQEGDSLREFGIDARVLELPGHTAGSLGLDVAGRGLFVGDAMMNLLRPECACLFAVREQAEESVERIRSLGRRRLYFGHGRPVEC